MAVSLGHLHSDFGCRDKEGLGEELRRGEVGSELRNGLHAVMEGFKIRVGLEDSLVVAETKNNLDHLVENEVRHRKCPSQVVFAAQVVRNLGHAFNGLVDAHVLVILLECRHHDGHKQVLKHTLQLNDSASLSDVASHEGGCPLVTNVHGDSRGLSQLEVAINDVR